MVPADARLAGWEREGIRVVCPGDPEWPTQLDVLGDARPLVLWLQGSADLRFACLRSVSVVGTRAATGYGTHVATKMVAALAERGFAVISDGPYGIDACAHEVGLPVSVGRRLSNSGAPFWNAADDRQPCRAARRRISA